MNADDTNFQRERLHSAAQSGHLDEVKILVSEGLDIDAFDEIGNTPLHYAAAGGHLAVARYLIEQGADVNAHHEPSIGNTPLGHIAGTCAFNMAKLLIDAGADPEIPGWMQITALHRAGERKRGDGPRVYELLLGALNRPRK